jgi:hypothetical protein
MFIFIRMSSESLDYRPSRKEPLDLESRDSSDTFEKNSLLGNRGSVPKMNKRTSWTSRPTCALLCSCIILIASTVIWSRVTFQLTKFSYDVREEDNFEPKCKCYWTADATKGFQLNNKQGGSQVVPRFSLIISMVAPQLTILMRCGEC